MTSYDDKIPLVHTDDKNGISYVSHWYIYSRLNEVFGNDNWSYEVLSLDCVSDSPVTYLSRVRVSINIGEKLFTRDDVGTGVGHGRAPHENAPKGAVTDGLKRAVHGLGQSFGLALYDTQKRFVASHEEYVKSITTLDDLRAFKELVEKMPDNESTRDAKKAIVDRAKELKNE